MVIRVDPHTGRASSSAPPGSRWAAPSAGRPALSSSRRPGRLVRPPGVYGPRHRAPVSNRARAARITKRAVAVARAATDPVTYLRNKRISDRTRHLYEKAFDEVVRSQSIARTAPMKVLDRALAAHLGMLYTHGDGVFAARTAFFGTVWSRDLPKHDRALLPLARSTLEGFVKSAPGNQGDPLPWPAALLLAHALTRRGTAECLTAARAIIVCFDGYLRVGSALQIRSMDIVVSPAMASASFSTVAVRLAPPSLVEGDLWSHRTKSGEYDDIIPFGDLQSQRAGRVLAANILTFLKRSVPGPRLVFPVTVSRLEKLMKEAHSELGLHPKLPGNPHALRHGGASADYAGSYRDLAAVQRRGCWKSSASVRRYEKCGRLQLMQSFLTPAHLRQSRLAASQLPSMLLDSASPVHSAGCGC